MEDDENLSNMELTILEIITQQRDIHIPVIMGQVQSMFTATGQPFDKALFRGSLLRLEKLGLIEKRKYPNSSMETAVVTEKGRALID
ncbi:MAG: hypothetical protein ACFFE8_10625 [Candidatus Heimdallarchaeota archaeon]